VGDGGVDVVALLLEDDVVELLDGARLVAGAEDGGAGEGVGEGVPALGQGLGDAAAGADGDVEDPDGGVGQVAHRVDAVRLAGDDLDGDAPLVDGGDGDLGGAQVAVSRLAHLEVLGQVDPELHADVGAAVGVLARHLGVHDAAAGGHELQVAGPDGAAVAGKVLVVDAARQQVRDGLLAAVRMVREACPRADGEVVEHQERAEVAQLGRADRAPHARPGALGLLDGQEGHADRAGDHLGVVAGPVCGERPERGGEEDCCDARQEREEELHAPAAVLFIDLTGSRC